MRIPLLIGCLTVSMLAVIACGSSSALTTSPSRTSAVRALVTPGPSPTGCGTEPPRRAWAEKVGADGRVTWQLRLPTDPTQSGISLQPLVVGGTAMFAEENAVYAQRIRDGHRLWRRAFDVSKTDIWANMVYGLWQWRGSVIVLVGQVSAQSRLLSLNAGTGAVRWTLPLGKQGETGNLTLTGDGGLAMIRGYATLTVVDLTTGRMRWGRTAGNSPGPAAAGGVVVAAADGQGGSPTGKVMGYDDRTGRLLWTRTGMPSQPLLLAVDGRVVVYGGSQAFGVTAMSPATGRTLWRVSVSAGVLSSGPAGLAFATYQPDRLYLVNPVTGRVRWHVSTFVNSSAFALVTGTDVVYIAFPPGIKPPGGQRLADLRASNGSLRWSVPLTGMPFVPESAVAFGGTYVVPQGSGQAGDPSRLVARRQSTGAVVWTTRVPTMVQVPPAVAGASLLVQPTDPAVGCPYAGAVSTAGQTG
jgi:outer membrane protein assembly factor BamB